MRRRLTIALASLLAIASAATASAAEPPPSAPAAPASAPTAPRLDSLVSLVVTQFPAVLAAEKDRAVAEGDLLAARGGFDPVWRTRAAWLPESYYKNGRLDTVVTQPTPVWGTSLFAGYRVGAGAFPVYDGKAATLDYGEVRAGVNVPLWRDGPIDARRAALWSAELGPKVAEAGVAAQKIDVVRVLALRYWSWAEAGRALEIARAQLRLAEERDQGLAERVRRGELAEVERQENLRAIASRRATVVSIERAREGARLDLLYHLQGIRGAPALGDGTPDLPDPGPPRSASAAEEVASALARRPELARFGVLKRQVSIEMDLARNQTRPAIDLQAAVSKDVGPGPDNLRPIDVELGLVIDLPVLARVGRGKLEAATAKLDKLDLQQTLFKNRLTADVNDALVAEAAARERIQLARTELAVARRLAQAERDALDLGSSTLLVVNLREQAVADAAFKEVSALADYHRAVAVLQAVTASQPGVVASAARVD